MALTGSSARRYAEALFEVATGEGAVAAYRASLERVAAALGPEEIRSLRDRRMALERRRAALEAAAASEPKAVRAVLVMLLERDRIALLPQVARAFGELVDRREGIVHAKITTPVELDERQQQDLVGRLERTSGKRLRATFATDPALIGGARIQLGDRLIDTSVRAQLDAMRAHLAS
jgi:F-type H+-transporting ATPase subunit delta